MLVIVTSILSAAAQVPAGQPPAGAAGRLAERAHYEAACVAARPRACHRLGLLLLLTGEDVQGAIDAFSAACDQGDISSCVSLGTIGTIALEPIALLAASCRQGDAQGCMWWGQAQDGAAAGQAYWMACQAGAAEGCWQRLQLHQQAVLPLEDNEALRLIEASCSGGIQEACASLRGSN